MNVVCIGTCQSEGYILLCWITFNCLTFSAVVLSYHLYIESKWYFYANFLERGRQNKSSGGG